MTKKSRKKGHLLVATPDGKMVWINSSVGSPHTEGNLEISKSRYGVFIGGDPGGLRSLAKCLMWLADVDQESIPTQPDGERCHLHLNPNDPGFSSLTPFSVATELCRLDAKGTGDFPDKYRKKPRVRIRRKSGKKR